jgi:hypothetical protein
MIPEDNANLILSCLSKKVHIPLLTKLFLSIANSLSPHKIGANDYCKIYIDSLLFKSTFHIWNIDLREQIFIFFLFFFILHGFLSIYEIDCFILELQST